MKRKKTGAVPEEVCAPNSDAKKMKKKKKDGNVESTDMADRCMNEELNDKKKFEHCEDVGEKKKKKKAKKQKDTTESADLTHSCKDEELNGKKGSEEVFTDVKKKKKKKKKKVKTETDSRMDATESADLTQNCMDEERNGKSKEQHRTKDGVEEDEGVADNDDEEEELTPEERRVLERKLKKIRKKEEKKKQKEEGKTTTKEEESKSSIAQTQALEYLTCWSEKRDEWKFQKTRQVWLLQHMYDREKVSDAHFSLLLSYLEGLQGVARDITVQKAEAFVRFGEGAEGEEGRGIESEEKTQRAREVVQILS